MMLAGEVITEMIQSMRQDLKNMPELVNIFRERYRPDVERIEGAMWEHSHGALYLKRFVIKGNVYELVELQDSEGRTETTLFIDLQREGISCSPTYLEAEISMVDRMQEDK